MHEYWVYILLCANGRFYAGVTNNVERRLGEHQNGIDVKCYTYSRRPLKLVYQHCFQNIDEAIQWEKHIKDWSQKKKKLLIEGRLFFE